MSNERVRFTVSISKDLFDEFENYRFENHVRTQTMAAEMLLRLGIDYAKLQKKAVDAIYSDHVTIVSNALKPAQNGKKPGETHETPQD